MIPIEDNNRKGDLAEYYAITFLWDQGFEVFRNAGCTGPIDLVAMSAEGDIILLDVKTLYPDPRSNNFTTLSHQLTEHQKTLGVHALAFNPETRELNFANHRHETTYTRYRDKQQSQYDLDLCDSGC